MNTKTITNILNDTDFIRTGGSAEELRAAEYLMQQAEKAGASAHIETFPVQMADIEDAELLINGKPIPCKGYKNCGSGSVEKELVYLPNTDRASLFAVKDKIVLLDSGISYWVYKDLTDAGAAGIITYDGNVNFRDNDIDAKELRGFVAEAAEGKKTLAVNINAKDAVRIVKSGAKTAKITIRQEESVGESRNVVAEIPGSTDEWVILTAHYDSTSLSHGAYDNMTGCIGLLGIMEEMAASAPNRYGLRFIFCGSEERGLLGSKAYVEAHKDEFDKAVLNINLDMIGSIMGKFISVVSAEEALVHYIRYIALETGWGLDARQGVYSSDSTPFADAGIPAVSFARIAGGSLAPIHNRYDTKAVVSPAQLKEDIDFLAYFTDRMANAVVCPVSREIPDNVKEDLDVYLNRKRKKVQH